MKLSRTAAHAVLAVAYLAECDRQVPVQARQIAGHLAIPTDSALKILQALSRQRLIRSQLGRGGGYRLDEDPRKLSLLRIVEAVDGPVQVQLPLSDAAPAASRQAVKRLRYACRDATRRLREDFDRITVAQLVA
ncbi:MAG: Rrf2 family transcriptional regulator [Phycisphaeraceae bacterium]